MPDVDLEAEKTVSDRLGWVRTSSRYTWAVQAKNRYRRILQLSTKLNILHRISTAPVYTKNASNWSSLRVLCVDNFESYLNPATQLQRQFYDAVEAFLVKCPLGSLRKSIKRQNLPWPDHLEFFVRIHFIPVGGEFPMPVDPIYQAFYHGDLNEMTRKAMSFFVGRLSKHLSLYTRWRQGPAACHEWSPVRTNMSRWLQRNFPSIRRSNFTRDQDYERILGMVETRLLPFRPEKTTREVWDFLVQEAEELYQELEPIRKKYAI